MQKILIIGGDEFSVPLINQCKLMDVEVLLTDKNDECIGKKLCDKFFCISAFEKEKILKVCVENKVDGVLTLIETFLTTVGYICEKLRLPGITQEVAYMSINKELLKKKLIEGNIPTAQYKCIKNNKELDEISKELIYPIIVKPVDSAGSQGVKVVRNYTELITAFNEAGKFGIEKYVILENIWMGLNLV